MKMVLPSGTQFKMHKEVKIFTFKQKFFFVKNNVDTITST